MSSLRRTLVLVPVLCCALASFSAAQAWATSSGVLSGWGDNTYGQLGDGNESWGYDSKVPVAVSGLSGVKAIAAGGSEGLAVMENGTVMAWGNNAGGELGNASNVQTSDVPVAVPGLSGVTAVASGDGQDLALLEGGTVMAWGANDYGQLGVGSTSGPETCSTGIACSRTPVPVNGLSGVKAIAANGEYSLALLDDGTVMAWGEDTWGQLGDGKSGEGVTSDVPVAVRGLSGVTAISAGNYDGLALLEDGTVEAWGVNGSGELGNGNTTGPESCVNGVACSTTPEPVSGLSGVTAIAEGGLHGLAVLSDGTVRSWGYNLNGQLGDGKSGEEADSDVPVAVSGLSGVSAVAAGKYDSLALLSNGTVESWGWDLLWELGNLSAEEQSLVPVPVNGLAGVSAIAANEGLSLAIGSAPTPFAQVTGLEPDQGPKAGGTSVTIAGINFTGASAVKFGSSEAASFTVNSSTSITAVSPAGSGNADVTVTTPEGTSYTSPRDLFHYGPPFQEEGPREGPREPPEGPREGEPGEGAVVSGESSSNVTEHTATIDADVNPQGTTEITYFVEYGATAAYGQSVPNPPETMRWFTCGLECEGEDQRPRPVSVNLTELQAGTTYHYRVVASNGRGVESYGQDATLTTLSSGAKPTIESVSVSGVGEHDATLEAQINPNGLASTYQFRLGKGCYPAACEVIADIPLPVEDLPSAQGEQSVSLDLNSVGVTLQPNSDYYYSVVATNSAGEASGDEQIFRTPSESTGENGGAQTGAASNVSQTGATLSGVVTAWGWRQATYVFEYGTTNSYGQSVPAPSGVIGPRITCGLPCGPAHSEQFTVSGELTGLVPNTTYHYRLVLTTNGHTSVGEDATFTTPEGLAEPLNITARSTTDGGAPVLGSGDSGQPVNPSSPTGPVASSPAFGVSPLGRTVPKVDTAAKKLFSALKACKKKPKSRREACSKQARRAYAAVARRGKKG